MELVKTCRLLFLMAFIGLSLNCAKTSPTTLSQCGDGIQQGNEACDDGSQNGAACPYGLEDCKACSENCTIIEGDTSYCGDGSLQEQEECDELEGPTTCSYGETFCWTCNDSCLQTPGAARYCGDGVIDTTDGEACDSGETPETCSYGTPNCSICSTTCQPIEVTGPFCGDGLLQTNHEICDDGNTESGDYCRADCSEQTGFCGDSIVQNNEGCDDGNNDEGDYCRGDCTLTTGSCGDAIVQSNEACDDGNTAAGDYCAADCTSITGTCGDGIIQDTEVCDDGNVAYGDYCAADCTSVTGSCGDGLRQSIEICDDGNNDESDYCSADCTTVTGACGDGSIQSNENCVDDNTADNDYCSADCQSITGACGDDTVQPNEACDDGNTDEGDYCQSDCMALTGSCGDGITQSNETCDDGNNAEDDYCAVDCQSIIGFCGDEIIQTNELCDDGNTEEGDYCASDCKSITGACGDSEIQSNEACDDGNTEEGDYCAADCSEITGSCGDSVTQTNEGCDDGNDVNNDDCLNTCVVASCGDGFIWEGQEDCDTALEHTGMNGTCYNCVFYCTENDSQVFINHNNTFSDGCEAPTFAQEFGPGDTNISIKSIAIDDSGDAYTAGAFTGLLENRTAVLEDGYLQKRDDAGELIWQATLTSANQMLPESENFTEEFIAVKTHEERVIALAHFCGSDEDDLGICGASLWEGVSTNHTECLNNNDCAEGFVCDFTQGQCVKKVFSQTATGKQNGLLLSLNSDGQVQWSVSFLSTSYHPPYAYANYPVNSFDTFTHLSALETDSAGNTYVAGRYKSAMQIHSSVNDVTQTKGSLTYCRTEMDCENATGGCSAPPTCGIDCNNDGTAEVNECLLEAYTWEYGFLAKVNAAGEVLYVADFPYKKMYNGFLSTNYTQTRILDIDLSTQANGNPLIAMVGSQSTTGSLPYLAVYEEIDGAPQLSWQTTQPEGSKTQRFENVRFDEDGGLWVTGYSTGYRNSTYYDYDLSFETCSKAEQPSEHILHFDGNDHVSLPSGQGLGYEAPLTIAGWFYVNDANSGPQTLWGGGANYVDSHMLYINNRKLAFQRCHSNGNCNVNLTSDENITSQVWTHFAFTVDGDTAKLYIDGSLDKESTSSSWITSDLLSPLFLGRRSADTEAFFFNGQLDDIGFWSRALPITQIQDLSTYPLLEGDLAQDLLAFYDMDASQNQLTSLINNQNVSATVSGAVSTYEAHWCRTPQTGCPAVTNRSGADSCATAFTCMLDCYAGPSEQLESCRDACTAHYEDRDVAQSSLYWLTTMCVETGACNSDPTEYCLLNPCGTEYRRCMNPNKDVAFAAYFNSSGTCEFNQAFYEDDGSEDDISSTRIHDLEVVTESAIFSVYDASESVHDTEILTWLSREDSIEGGSAILWSQEIVSPDQSPINITDIAFHGLSLYWAAEYQSQADMSFVVDFTQDENPPELDHTACSTESCDATGMLIKSLIFSD